MNKGLKAFLIVASIVAVFALGFGTCYFFVSSTEKKTNETSAEESMEGKEIPAHIVNDLTANIKDVYSAYYSYDYVNGFKSISQDKVIYFAITANQSSYNQPVSFDNVKQYITKYFGENYNYTNHDIICNLDKEVLFKIDNTTKEYILNNSGNIHGHDGGNGYRVARNNYVKVLSSTYEEENIVIKAKILYGTSCLGTCGPNNMYFANPNDSQPILGGNSIDYEYVVTEEDYERVKSTLDTTTFTFSKNSNGSYYLSNVEVKQD